MEQAVTRDAKLADTENVQAESVAASWRAGDQGHFPIYPDS